VHHAVVVAPVAGVPTDAPVVTQVETDRLVDDLGIFALVPGHLPAAGNRPHRDVVPGRDEAGVRCDRPAIGGPEQGTNAQGPQAAPVAVVEVVDQEPVVTVAHHPRVTGTHHVVVRPEYE
jgi:hypothetical protein